METSRVPAAIRCRPRRAASRARAGMATLLGPAGQCDELVQLVELLHLVDVATEEIVDRLSRLQRTGEIEEATGVPLELWLAVAGRRTAADARMLQTAADVLERLPMLAGAFADGDVSWSQVRAVVLAVRPIPSSFDAEIDACLARLIEDCRDAEPDGLARAVSMVLAAQEAGSTRPAAPAEEQYLAMQPRLDGSGGRVWGEFRAEGFAVLDACLNASAPAPSGRSRDQFGQRQDPQRARRLATSSGSRRARRLLDLVTRGARVDEGGGLPPATGPAEGPPIGAEPTGGDRDPSAGLRPPARLLLRMELSTLLGGTLPAELLTTLTGGRMRVDAATARRIADESGTSVRAVVVDTVGQVVGVGRRTRVPPGWLRDAILAVHDTCTAPGCHTAARVCHADHAIPVRDGGPTDVINLAPLCGTENQARERDGWEARGCPDGARVWHHPRSGLTVRTLPATWRPPVPEVCGCACRGDPPAAD